MNVKIMGADLSVTNLTVAGDHWQGAVQAAASRARVYKISFSPLAGAVDVYAWLYDLAAGTTGSAAPVLVRYVPAGFADTWDLGPDGSLFRNGIYLVLSTAAPTDPTTTPAGTLAGNDKVLVKLDIRIG